MEKTTKSKVYNDYGKDKTYIMYDYGAQKNLFGTPDYYTTRAEGFAAHVWYFGLDFCITCGYAPFGGKTIDYEKGKKYVSIATKIWSNRWSYKRKQTEINKLVEKFINDVKSGILFKRKER